MALRPWLAIAFVAAAALIQQSLSALNCDVSWLITIAERLLDGARLYRDIEEVNPPASVLLYVPAVALARLLGLRPEALTVALVAVLAILSVRHAGRILPPLPARATLVSAACAFILLILPADLFAQREHIALLAGLPMLAVIVSRSLALPVRAADARWAGLAGGILVVIKPHLILALALPALWSALRRRTLDAAWAPEWIALALVCAGYFLLVLLAFPEYFTHMLPLLRLVYLPGRDSWHHLLTGTMVTIPATAAILTFWLARARPSEPAIVALLAAAGFALAGLVQGKGYLNHGYPAVASALLAITLELARPGKARAFGALCAATLALFATYSYARVPQPTALRDAVQRLGPSHPRLIGVSFDFSLGHPLTRWVEGTWVGTRGNQWATGNAWQQLEDPALSPAARRAYEQAERADAALLTADIIRYRPDIILVDEVPGPTWIAGNPPLARAMQRYRPATRVANVTLWTPR